jgi:hypothetical protein
MKRPAAAHDGAHERQIEIDAGGDVREDEALLNST